MWAKQEITIKIVKEIDNNKYYYCGDCYNNIDLEDNYCKHCGAQMKYIHNVKDKKKIYSRINKI